MSNVVVEISQYNGYYYASSYNVRGLHLSNKSIDELKEDVPKAVAYLRKENEGKTDDVNIVYTGEVK